jgi:hypothetical protein
MFAGITLAFFDFNLAVSAHESGEACAIIVFNAIDTGRSMLAWPTCAVIIVRLTDITCNYNNTISNPKPWSLDES